MSNPTRAACGACHDDVNFATGKNHVDLPQLSDKDCTQCHLAKSDKEFDASVKGAHTVATRSQQLEGVDFTIMAVDNAKPGQKPSVTFMIEITNNIQSLTTFRRRSGAFIKQLKKN